MLHRRLLQALLVQILLTYSGLGFAPSFPIFLIDGSDLTNMTTLSKLLNEDTTDTQPAAYRESIGAKRGDMLIVAVMGVEQRDLYSWWV